MWAAMSTLGPLLPPVSPILPCPLQLVMLTDQKKDSRREVGKRWHKGNCQSALQSLQSSIAHPSTVSWRYHILLLSGLELSAHFSLQPDSSLPLVGGASSLRALGYPIPLLCLQCSQPLAAGSLSPSFPTIHLAFLNFFSILAGK